MTEFGLISQQRGSQSYEFFPLGAFEQAFPDFDVPDYSRRLAEAGYNLASAMGDRKRYSQQIIKWDALCPWMEIHDGVATLKNELPDEYFHHFWDSASSDTTREQHARLSTQLVLRWTRRDVENGILTTAYADRLLDWPECDLNTSPHCPVNQSAGTEAQSPRHCCPIFFGRPDGPAGAVQWKSSFDKVKEWLLKDQDRSLFQRLTLLKEIQLTRYLYLCGYQPFIPLASRRMDISNIRYEAKANLDLHQAIRQRIPEVVSEDELLTCRYQHASIAADEHRLVACHLLELSKGAIQERHRLDLDQNIQDTISEFTQLTADYRNRDQLSNMIRASNSIGELINLRFQFLKLGDADACLPHFRNVEEAYRCLCMGDSLARGAKALLVRDDLATRFNMALLFAKARTSAVVALDVSQATVDRDVDHSIFSDHRRLQEELTYWSQNTKARALTDVLGLGADMPRSMMAEIQQDPRAARLVLQERILHTSIPEASISQKLHLREQLQALREDMRRAGSSLTALLNIRDGRGLNREEIDDMHQRLGSDVVIVEWMMTIGIPAEMWMLIFRSGKPMEFRPLGYITRGQGDKSQIRYAKLGEIDDWVNRYLSVGIPFKRRDHRDESPYKSLKMKEVACLVAPLEELTKPGQTLILCPTRSLHRVPLHALSVAGTALIDRNKTIYTQSLSVLNLTLYRLRSPDFLDPSDRHTIALINTRGPQDTPTITELSRLLGPLASSSRPVQAIEGCDRAQFLAAVGNARIVHVHGHVEMETAVSDADPRLRHHLIIAYPKDDPANQLTAYEICDLQFQPGALVMAMGCNSGRANSLTATISWVLLLHFTAQVQVRWSQRFGGSMPGIV